MKKIALLLLMSFCLISDTNAITQQERSDRILVNQITENLVNTIENSGKNKTRLASLASEKLKRYTKNLNKNSRKKIILTSIIENIEEKYVKNFEFLLIRIDNGFTRQEIKDIIHKNQNEITENDNIFIFRYKLDLGLSQVQTLSSEIKKLNPKARIFIDQEWGYINRFREFEDWFSLWQLLRKDEEAFEYYHLLTDDTKWKIHKKVSWRKYFMSMKEIGDIYREIKPEDKKLFLDFIAHYRLASLKNAGINTYWLVLDLDYWNPVISDLRRSFWDDTEAYIELWKSFVDAALDKDISLYLKHFPGHWEWNIDTHKSLLTYDERDIKYIKENIKVFNKVLDYWNTKWVEIGLMVGHIELPKSIKYLLHVWFSKTDYVMTDDLSMFAYWEWIKKDYDDTFFSTKEALAYKKVIKVRTWINEIK